MSNTSRSQSKHLTQSPKVLERKQFYNLFYDGFNSKLIETAFYESFLEFPTLEAPKKIIIPTIAVPFSKRAAISNPSTELLVFYEQDSEFRDFVSIPQKFIDELENVNLISTPDCSLYRDMPLWEQVANIGVSRSIGYYLQQQGKYVIPNARWGDERTYSKKIFDFAPAFVGLPHNSIVSIGTYGCSKKKEDKYYLEAGLEAMLTELTPQVVIVYGSYNQKIFEKYEVQTHFVHIPDWITNKHSKVEVS